METTLSFEKVRQMFQETDRKFQEMAQEMARLSKEPERRHCSRNPKWGPSDIGCTK